MYKTRSTTATALIFSLLCSNAVFAARDSGTIGELYLSGSGGRIAFTLKEGFSNADLAGECLDNNGFVGTSRPSDGVVQALLDAKKSNSTITVITDTGCDIINGRWYRLRGVIFPEE